MRNALEFKYKFWHKTIYGKHFHYFTKWFFKYFLIELSLSFLFNFILLILFFIWRGKSVVGINKLSGGEIVSPKQLTKLIKKNKQASKINIANVPLIKDTERQHILLTGTTGTGKSTLLHQLIPQILNLGQRAIIVDPVGEFYQRYFNPVIDVLLNPFDNNSADWLPWNDCINEYDYDAIASAFISSEGNYDKFWEEAAQKVFSTALYMQKDERNLSELIEVLLKKNIKEFSSYFEDSFAEGLISKESEKTAASIRGVLINKIEKLKYLKSEGTFSIREWVNHGKGSLFININPMQRDTLIPLASAWIDIAIKALMERGTINNSNLWFLLDELSALKKIPALTTGLAEGRKYGACFVVAVQTIDQLEYVYGKSRTNALLDFFNTNIIFRTNNPHTAEYASKILGSREVEETKESLSYGANSLRDGVNINSNQAVKPIVLPHEISQLKNLSCYLKLADVYPITKLKLKI